MLLKKYLTEYDEDISADIYVDPLGVLVVWSKFGQHIFNNKVNSISNDVRNYTLNLINHAVIKSVIDDDCVVLNKSLRKFVGDKNSLTFKFACLVYLENIFTFAITDPKSRSNVDSRGVLGSSKARKVWEESCGNPKIYFSHIESEKHKRYHLLVRQLGLGVSGRYRTPFLEIGFFKGQYDYHYSGGEMLWLKLDELLKKSSVLNNLFNHAKKQLSQILTQPSPSSNKPPVTLYSELPVALIRAFRKALPNSQSVGRETRNFWLDVTKLSEGAAGALLTELENNIEKKESKFRVSEYFARAAKNNTLSDFEKQKLNNVLTLEPLLGELDTLFTLTRSRKSQSIDNVVKLWKDLNRDDNTLPTLANKVTDKIEIYEAVSGTSEKRLKQLINAASQQEVIHQIKELLNYHAKVMRIRGQQPWVEIEGDTITVHARTANLPSLEQRPLSGWVNNYYLYQFNNLVRGFYGNIK